TASGAVAVQVARKDRGRVVILAHLGSAHTDAELGILLEQAREMVVGGQAALDFEVAVRAQSMADVADFRAQALISERATPAVAAPVVPPGRTVGASSRLLYDVLGHVYDGLGFDAVGDAVFRDLVISRIVEPTSKLDATRVLADLGARLVSYKTIDSHARKIHSSGHRDTIAEKCFAYASDYGGLSLILYDVTTLYFEAESEIRCARSAIPKSVESILKLWSDCWSTGPDFPWRSAVSRAIPLRPPRSCRSSPAFWPASICRAHRWWWPPTQACSRRPTSPRWMR